ncbi:hypothetical protein DFP72DRAFT_1075266 [Ephemerocybe angulata]|uniref:Uncharacterized protein n=1 Tax=Ephemerocybe angulata TaxID=980116 RepID=A0A8H6LX94_9AGAR|nr:hypothetical protein DFP72DRAFT_860455 [Tulosesus angulatus]KAF6747393.1 hypothetical protein DFP72DRAFT_1075266 [Tulosesus angulatus]
MKLSIASLFGILIGSSSLLTSAYAYGDYDDLDVRSGVDYHSERDLGFDARSTIDVPFHPSLRAFLEDAATAHTRRALSLDDSGGLEAREIVSLNVIGGGKQFYKWFDREDTSAKVRAAIAQDGRWDPRKKIHTLHMGKSGGQLARFPDHFKISELIQKGDDTIKAECY